MPSKGSSRKIKLGLETSSTAIMVRRLSPRLMPSISGPPTCWSWQLCSQNASIKSFTLLFCSDSLPASLIFAVNSKHSLTVKCCSNVSSLFTKALIRFRSLMCWIRTPLSLTCPLDLYPFEGSLPAMYDSNVVLPEPSTPRIVRMDPGRHQPVTSSSFRFFG